MDRKNCLLYILIWALVGCDPRGCNLVWQSDFYGYLSREDLIRIPLIQPYELLTLSNLESDSIDETNHLMVSWELRFKHISQHSVNTTDFNVINGVIYGNGKRTVYAPNDYFIIVPARKLEKTFKNESEWKDSLVQMGINPENLVRPWPIFKQFEKDLILPWHDPEKGIDAGRKK
jgi:hypothetical protein